MINNNDAILAFLMGMIGLRERGVMYLLNKMYDIEQSTRIVNAGTVTSFFILLLCVLEKLNV